LALTDSTDGAEALELVRSLIERVELRPMERDWEIELTGAIAPMVALATGNENFVREPFASSVKVVAGAGFEPATFRL